MSGDQIGGVGLVILGTIVIAFRRFIYVGRDVDVYRPENNLANPSRSPTNLRDQRLIIGGGIFFILLGVAMLLEIPIP